MHTKTNLSGKTFSKHKSKGFTLIEIIVALAILGVVIAGILYYQSRAEAKTKANDTISALTTMIGGIKSAYAPANSYATVTNQNLNSSGLVVQPFTGSTTSITDAWAHAVTFNGNATQFGFSLQSPDPETCIGIVSGLSRNAIIVRVGAASISGGVPSGGSAVKASASAAYDPAAAATGCGTANAVIAMAFR